MLVKRYHKLKSCIVVRRVASKMYAKTNIVHIHSQTLKKLSSGTDNILTEWLKWVNAIAADILAFCVVMGPFYKNKITLIPSWISNHMRVEVWDEITHSFSNFNSCSIEVWVWLSNLTAHSYNGCDYLSIRGSKLILVSTKDPGHQQWY